MKIGKVIIGDKSPILVQSMLSVPSYDLEANIQQAIELERCGCDIIRVAVPTRESVRNICAIKEKVNVPVVADIHFDYRLALESIEAGVDKVRINPKNIGDVNNLRKVVKKCALKGIPIRIGVNSGSVEKKLLIKYNHATPEALCESAMNNARILEEMDFNNIVISVKSSNPFDTVRAYRLIAEKCDYPLHVGITESGTENLGKIKSAIAIGSLLIDGIGDTIRVSLTADPKKEVEIGIDILKSLGMYKGFGIEFISCPTCGRTRIDVAKIANQVEKFLSNSNKKLKVAIMGCIVNGPGEAREADIGIAGGDGVGIIFEKGKIVKKVEEKYLVKELISRIEKM